MDDRISRERFHELASPLVGLPVTQAVQGYGSSIFLELGRACEKHWRIADDVWQGCEASINVHMSWRVEYEQRVLFGSWSDARVIREGIKDLVSHTVTRVWITDGIPELMVLFSNDTLLRSCMTFSGNPQWHIELPDDRWVDATQGYLRVQDNSETDHHIGTAPSDERDLFWRHSKQCAERWGSVQPPAHIAGECSTCEHYLPFDGPSAFFDYGVCTSPASRFDGRVVRCDGACPFFSPTPVDTSQSETTRSAIQPLSSEIFKEEFHRLTRSIICMTVSNPWKGYGSAIFFELGELHDAEYPSGKPRKDNGEATVVVEWSWRVERDGTVLFGSLNTGDVIEEEVLKMKGLEIAEVDVEDGIPELVIWFSNGDVLRSFITIEEPTQWHIHLPDDEFIQGEDASAEAQNSSPASRAEETRVNQHAEHTTDRWEKIVPSEHVLGRCSKCSYFLRLSGSVYFREYGACTNPASQFDGQVVSQASGCPAFSSELASRN